jgi:Uma2 family endonuclease
MVTLQISQLEVLPGQRIVLQNVNWPQFEAILEELGEYRATRLAFYQGTLEIVAPLPEHEPTKVVLTDLLKVLLDELDLDWDSLSSTTFKREKSQSGIEPDDCFYIQNHAAMIGRDRIGFTVDPSPDLVIEIDVTSKTQLSAHEALQVPEIWRWQNRKLQISVLRDGNDQESQSSLTVPDFPVVEGISQFLEMSRTAGTHPDLKAFRLWIREQL